MPLKIRLADIVSGLMFVIRRFPLAALTCLIAYACCLALLESPQAYREVELFRVIFVCTLALPLFFALTLLREQSSQHGIARYAPEAIGLALLIAYGTWWLIQPKEVPFKHYVCHGLLLLAVHFFVACAPFLKRGHDDGFWNYNKSLFLRYLLGVLYSVVLFAGLALALLSVDRLLALKIEGENYGRLFLGIVTVFHPLFFLAGISKHFTQADSEFLTTLRRFVQFCLMPLVVIYLAILYLYTARIIITWELPNGWVALPVLILSVIGILSALLLDPLRDNEEFPWAGKFTRWFYRLLLPLTILLMISIGVRIADYGVTENRYFVAILAGWLFVVALCYGIFKARSTRWIPLSLGIICLLSAWGPWSAPGISLRSQKAMVMEDFERLRVLSDGKLIAKSQTIAAQEYTGIRSRLQYLFYHHDPRIFDEMMQGFPNWAEGSVVGSSSASISRYTSNQRADHLLETLNINSAVAAFSSYSLQANEPFAVKADGVVSQHNSQYRWQKSIGDLLPDSKLTLTFDEANRAILKTNTEMVAVDWEDAIAGLPHIGDQIDVAHDQLTQNVEISDYRVELTATKIYLQRVDGKPQINSLELLVIVYPRED